MLQQAIKKFPFNLLSSRETCLTETKALRVHKIKAWSLIRLYKNAQFNIVYIPGSKST